MDANLKAKLDAEKVTSPDLDFGKSPQPFNLSTDDPYISIIAKQSTILRILKVEGASE